ncbi:hypothetical protein MGYG_05571 [Nannizzia gypsea CBS 118893]|uniref:Uncharacterized protein n=1 Tax=Arthroderma gypseum (strain ATCC MYA-4604 / CBS 118893) TaxID=535722 RepID=E4UWN2_ARTGP|nr:hypothetical protein MGYG_05571 [Nannizzia gypsea CBS 118893]EFR02575.1 hypothetical protein MGYG_05571 [Nannizzia gypsea CBS 118893]
MSNIIAPLEPGSSSTRTTRPHNIPRMFVIEILLTIASLLLVIVSLLLEDQEAHAHQRTTRTELSNDPSLDTSTENLFEGAGIDGPGAPENESWIMEYPTHRSTYHSSNSSSEDSSSEDPEEEVIPTLEALWADWNPEPEPIDYPDRPTTPGILETAVANDTGSLWSVSGSDTESNQLWPPQPATPNSIQDIFNPTGELEMSDIE